MKNWIKAVLAALSPFAAVGIVVLLAFYAINVLLVIMAVLCVGVFIYIFIGMAKDAKKYFDEKEQDEQF